MPPELTSPPAPLRVMIVDDFEPLRLALPMLLSIFDDIEVVAATGNASEAVRLCQQHQPDVILMDVHMSGMSGIEATRLIRSDCPAAKVLALTSSVEDTELEAMHHAGVIGVVPKSVNADELAEAIRRAAAA